MNISTIAAVALIIAQTASLATAQPEAEIAPVSEENYEEEAIIEEEEIIEESEPEEPEEAEPELEYIGTFEMTAYEWTGYPCANGRYPEVGYTVACNSLPLGTKVYIEGVGYRVVEDRGADWHADNWMDLYLGDVASCYEWGIRTVDVYIVR